MDRANRDEQWAAAAYLVIVQLVKQQQKFMWMMCCDFLFQTSTFQCLGNSVVTRNSKWCVDKIKCAKRPTENTTPTNIPSISRCFVASEETMNGVPGLESITA
jgi:hypothetical protein